MPAAHLPPACRRYGSAPRGRLALVQQAPRSRRRCRGCGSVGRSGDEGGDAGGAREDGGPLLECEVGRDDGRPQLMAAADQVVEEIGGARVGGQVAEFVEHEQVGRGVALQATLQRGQRLLA